MTNENPNPREVFDQNEANIAQTKKAIAEAATTGEYDKVAALAQEAKIIETANVEMSTVSQEAINENKAVGDAQVAQEKAKRQIELAEQMKLQAEKDALEAAQLLEKLTGKNVGATSSEVPAETPMVEPVPLAQTEAPAPAAEARDWEEERRIAIEETEKQEKTTKAVDYLNKVPLSKEWKTTFDKFFEEWDQYPGLKPNEKRDEVARRIESLRDEVLAHYKAEHERELNS